MGFTLRKPNGKRPFWPFTFFLERIIVALNLEWNEAPFSREKKEGKKCQKDLPVDTIRLSLSQSIVAGGEAKTTQRIL